jgi:methylmalonyl-CoA mutase N-terminal domain/subunit
VAAIDAGFQQNEIEESAYTYARRVESGAVTVVGVNRFTSEDDIEAEVLRVEPHVERRQVAALTDFRAHRDEAVVNAALNELRAAARTDENLLYPMRAALEADATVGEVAGALASVFGKY